MRTPLELRVYVIRRIILLFFVFIGVTALVFWIALMVPSDPAFLWVGGGQTVPEEYLEKIRIEYHLHDPWYVQYWYYLNKILHGDLGISPLRRVPVARELASYLPQTIELVSFGLMVGIIFGITIGIISATRRDTVVDHASRIWALAVISLPTFWIGLMFQLIFYYQLGWVSDPGGNISQQVLFQFPLQKVTGFNMLDALITGNWPVASSILQHLILPGLLISFGPTAMIGRITRASMLEVMTQDYVRTARAYGLPERIVIYRLALKNAMIPTTTTIGLAVGHLVTGSVIVETIFYWPGMGRYAVEAIQSYDFPSLIGYVTLVSLVYASANLIVDLLYAILDPRIRVG